MIEQENWMATMRIWSMWQKKNNWLELEGIEEGIEKGIEKGAISTIVGLIKDGILTIESGAKRLNISESELTAYMQ